MFYRQIDCLVSNEFLFVVLTCSAHVLGGRVWKLPRYPLAQFSGFTCLRSQPTDHRGLCPACGQSEVTTCQHVIGCSMGACLSEDAAEIKFVST